MSYMFSNLVFNYNKIKYLHEECGPLFDRIIRVEFQVIPFLKNNLSVINSDAD